MIVETYPCPVSELESSEKLCPMPLLLLLVWPPFYYIYSCFFPPLSFFLAFDQQLISKSFFLVRPFFLLWRSKSIRRSTQHPYYTSMVCVLHSAQHKFLGARSSKAYITSLKNFCTSVVSLYSFIHNDTWDPILGKGEEKRKHKAAF